MRLFSDFVIFKNISETSRALIADLEDTETAAAGGQPDNAARIKKGVVITPSSMNFEQFIVDTDAENGPSSGEKTAVAVDSRTAATPGSGGKNIMFEMLEIDADGNKHTRTLSYEEALAEGQLPATEPLLAGSTKSAGTGLPSGSSGTAAKSKTKTVSSQERR